MNRTFITVRRPARVLAVLSCVVAAAVPSTARAHHIAPPDSGPTLSATQPAADPAPATPAALAAEQADLAPASTPAPEPAAPTPAAAHGRCTIVGTAGKDVLRGTSGRDIICGLGGNDTIDGRGGSDELLGGAGDDRLTGGAGRDVLAGQHGNDTLVARDGDVDRVTGGAGRDSVRADSRDLVASVERGAAKPAQTASIRAAGPVYRSGSTCGVDYLSVHNPIMFAADTTGYNDMQDVAHRVVQWTYDGSTWIRGNGPWMRATASETYTPTTWWNMDMQRQMGGGMTAYLNHGYYHASVEYYWYPTSYTDGGYAHYLATDAGYCTIG